VEGAARAEHEGEERPRAAAGARGGAEQRRAEGGGCGGGGAGGVGLGGQEAG
jgi:hypothetical protein